MKQNVLPSVEVSTAASPDAAVIWLHGLGADGHDFAPAVPGLRLRQGLAVRFVFPHAPVRPVTINAGMEMRAWYDIYSFDRDDGEDEAGIRDSEAQVRRLIEREAERGVPPSRIAVAGFSQGGAIALQAALRVPERLAGVVALSAYLPLARTLAAEVSAESRGTPVFLAHGAHDDLLPAALGLESRRRLEELGYAVEWHEYPIAHSVSLDELRDIGAFLSRALEPRVLE